MPVWLIWFQYRDYWFHIGPLQGKFATENIRAAGLSRRKLEVAVADAVLLIPGMSPSVVPRNLGKNP